MSFVIGFPYLLVLKSRSIWWAWHVAHVEDNKCIQIVTGKPEGTLGSPRSRWENNIRKNIIAIRLIGLEWINSPSIWTSSGLMWTGYWTFGFHNSVDLLTSWRTASFSRKILFHWITNTIRRDLASAHAWCVSTHVWCAVGARLWSCKFATTSDPCPTLHGWSRPGYSAGFAHASAKQHYTCSKNIHSFRSHLFILLPCGHIETGDVVLLSATCAWTPKVIGPPHYRLVHVMCEQYTFTHF